MSEKIYGLIAEFDSPAAILHAAEKVRDAGYRAGTRSRRSRFTAWTR
jgi:hypothetical protein